MLSVRFARVEAVLLKQNRRAEPTKNSLVIYSEGTKPMGTGLLGYFPKGTAYADLVHVFGQPQRGESSDGKTKTEWVGPIDGLNFTIYDYKSDIDPKDNSDRYIGSRTALRAKLLAAYFNVAKAHMHR